MKRTQLTESAFSFFKKSYAAKMGGTQTVVLPNGKSKSFDDRNYYSGRGAKYNNSINHSILGEVKVSKKEYSEFLKFMKERENVAKARLLAQKEKEARVQKAKENGIYSIEASHSGGFYVEL